MSSEEADSVQFIGQLFDRYQRAVEEGNTEDATEALGEILALAQQWCEEHPSPDMILNVAAGESEERADWAAAESAYQQILSLPDLEPAIEYRAHGNLASLYRLLGRESDALDHARRATVATRRSELEMLLCMALQGEAGCLIESGQVAEACEVIQEATSWLEDDSTYDQIRANTLTLRAKCAIHTNSLDEAKRDLQQAYRLLEPLAEFEFAAGARADLAHWWSVTARLRTATNDLEEAVDAWQKAVTLSRNVAAQPHADSVHSEAAVARMLKGLADALESCGRGEQAGSARQQEQQIVERLGLPARFPD